MSPAAERAASAATTCGSTWFETFWWAESRLVMAKKATATTAARSATTHPKLR